MIKKAIAKVVEREDLTEGEMIDVMNQIMSGECTPAQIGSFITALRMKGETIEEITGAARVMRERATPIRVGKGVVDIDELSLTSSDGQELLKNGYLEANASHWLYSSDKHLAWHMKNLWLQVYFDSGWTFLKTHGFFLDRHCAGTGEGERKWNSIWFVVAAGC